MPTPGGAEISKIRWRPWRQITGTGPALALRACAGKSRKADGSRVVRWGKSLEWFSSVQFSSEAGQRLTEFCQENTLVIADILF